MPEPPVRIESAKGLTPQEREVEQRAIDNLQTNLPALVAGYREKYGSEISTDNARDIVSPDYAASREAATEWSRATQRPAAALANYLYDEALRHPDSSKARIVLMTAGGTGAGKTTALRHLPELARDSQLVYDSNLGSKRSSLEKIEAALSAGNDVRILFVHREPVEALVNGVLPRAMEEGRVVDLDAHTRMYRDSVENLKYLARRYESEPRVQLSVWDNSRGPGNGRLVPIETLAGIRYSSGELLPRLHDALETEYGNGRISQSVYRATLGAASPEAAGGVACHSGSGASETGGASAAGQHPCGDVGRGTRREPEPQRPRQEARPQGGLISE